MPKERVISLRRLLFVLVVVMGALGIALSLFTGAAYRDLALENQRQYVSGLLEVETGPVLAELTETAVEMVGYLYEEPGFVEALAARDEARLTALLDEQFHQYFITAEVIRVARLAVLDRQLRPLAVAREGALGAQEAPCPETMARLRARQGVDRLHTATALCHHRGRPLWLVVHPVGGLIPKAYVQVLADPVPVLLLLSQALRLPVAVADEDGRLLATSEDWRGDGGGRRLLATYRLQGEGGDLILQASKDVSALLTRLDEVRAGVITLGLLITVVLGGLFWLVLNRLALDPLDRLHLGLTRLTEDKETLGHTLEPQGVVEVQALTEAFNRTTRELRDLYDTLERMAYTDALTRLPNRSRFNEMLAFHTELGRHRLAPFALFIMDLDRFKWVNDNLGHPVGDVLLAEVAERLSSVLRKTDVVSRVDLRHGPVARLGGDEFAALIPGVRNEEEAVVVARKIAAAMARPFILEGRPVEVGISIGIALSPQHGRDPALLMRLADVAMYQAKQAGCAYQVYDEERDRSRLVRDSMEGALRAAVASGEGLSLVYQPQVNLSSGRVVGVEALLRWAGFGEGPVSPAVFVPIAEQCGLMPRLTRWVLETALDQCQRWYREGRQLRVAVNLSAHNLAERDLADFVREALAQRALPARLLCLEITETQLVAEPDLAQVQLRQLAEMGVCLSLDDFGTGYSSLTYLQRLPLEEIKIDRCFVSHLVDNPEDRVIVEAIIALARGLGKEVLAEGVESLPVQEALRAMGCRLAQGYFIARPMAPSELARWLDARRPRSAGGATS